MNLVSLRTSHSLAEYVSYPPSAEFCVITKELTPDYTLALAKVSRYAVLGTFSSPVFDSPNAVSMS